MNAQLALRYSFDSVDLSDQDAERTQRRGPSVLHAVPTVESSDAKVDALDDFAFGRNRERGGEKLATVHRLVTDFLAAEPAVVSDVRRAAGGPQEAEFLASSSGTHAKRGAASSIAVYRRRRLTVCIALGLLVSTLSLLGGELFGRVTGTHGSAVVGATVEPTSYVVQPGDTLWSIAALVTPEGRDLRDTVDRLSEANGGPVLQPGQQILLSEG